MSAFLHCTRPAAAASCAAVAPVRKLCLAPVKRAVPTKSCGSQLQAVSSRRLAPNAQHKPAAAAASPLRMAIVAAASTTDNSNNGNAAATDFSKSKDKFDFDVFVIGGGSGGVRTARKAAENGEVSLIGSVTCAFALLEWLAASEIVWHLWL